jgi:D-tagatose-1,6-bisphosphate aldolase subunit GatZ/KbaZ
MEIKERIDNSFLRLEAESKNRTILELLVEKLEYLFKKEKIRCTLFAICPNSEMVLKAAIRSAKKANAPVLFAATLNQVDIDRGYTGWMPEDLIARIKEESFAFDYNGPSIVGIDHGGPWLKDKQTIERWDLKRSMDWIKKSFEAALLAGYDLIHVDPTVDIFNKIEIEKVVERTIELINHVETFIKKMNLKHVSYEVGTEEVHGGLADMDVFNKFLVLLKDGLAKKNLKNIWPVFVVAKVGTDLHTSTFDPGVAKEVAKIASSYGSYIKGHYTDFVDNPGDYPESNIGAANVGPEFTVLEFEAFERLCQIEDKLFKDKQIAIKSGLIEVLKEAVINSGRWKKWLLKGEVNFDVIDKERKEWIIKTSSRYVWANPDVRYCQQKLFRNLSLNGIDGEDIVLGNIERGMDRYFMEFNLLDLNSRLRSFEGL